MYPQESTPAQSGRIPGNGGLKQAVDLSPIAENFNIKQSLLEEQAKIISLLRSKLQAVMLEPDRKEGRAESPEQVSSALETVQRNIIRQLRQNNEALSNLLESIRL